MKGPPYLSRTHPISVCFDWHIYQNITSNNKALCLDLKSFQRSCKAM
uniref:Bm14255 n=1 Tax=Brugia malayi TaxID=6279 RepID=A0A0J9Y0H0_BRUMA|nr:Bm14255 [Brugia malayi]